MSDMLSYLCLYFLYFTGSCPNCSRFEGACRTTSMCEAFVSQLEKEVPWYGIEREFMKCCKGYKYSRMEEGNVKDQSFE